MINPMDLTGKHILITGGSSGIGRACAIQASKLGAKVTIIARREDKLRETISMLDGTNHCYYCADLAEISCIEGLVERIIRECGNVDGLCHAAGIADVRTLKYSNYRFFDKMFRINAFAFFEIVRCLSLKCNFNDDASVVGISSAAAEKGNISQGIYAAAKAAMNAFIVPAAAELASRRIRINTVAFAMVNTVMYDSYLEIGNTSLSQRQYLGIIDVESAANSVMYLLSDASKYITATVLPVYAGY